MFAQDAPTLFGTPPIVPRAKPKGGMFGGATIDPAAFLAAFAAGLGNPAGLHALRSIQERRAERQRLQMDEEQYQRRRQDDLADYEAKKGIDAKFPSQNGPHYFEDNSGNLMAVGQDGQPFMVHKDPNPWRLVPNGLGGVVPVNMQDLMAGQAPAKPVGNLTPIDEGGPTLGGSGGFRY